VFPALKIDFYTENIDFEKIIYVVIIAFYRERLVLVRHRERATWEIPGGHLEIGENNYNAAKRELYEETGAKKFQLERICDYSVTREQAVSYGTLFLADIDEIGELPDFEIYEIGFFDHLPSQLTYPEIQPFLLKKALDYFSKRYIQKDR